MVVVRAGLPLVVLLLVAVPAQALYEDLTFTVSATDGADAADFLDIRELAFAEPGDGTVVFRLKTAGHTAIPTSTVDLFFAANGKSDYRISHQSGGGAGAGFKSCTVDGSTAYCILTHETLGGGVGTVMSQVRAISYAGSAVDWAPSQVPAGVQLALAIAGMPSYGKDYLLVGCTKTDAAACSGAGVADPGTVFGNLTSARLLQSFSVPTTGEYVYNFTQPLARAVLQHASNGTGNLTLLVADGNGTVHVNQTLAAGSNGTFALDGVAPGNWSYTIQFEAFNGTLELDIVAPANTTATSTTASGTATSTRTTSGSSTSAAASGSDTASTSPVAEAPGPAAPLVLLLVGALVVVRRRKA